MSYMWNEFNIKTFPAETIVYRDGNFCPELSTISNNKIETKYDLPVHIIYVGEIAGKKELKIEINVENQPVFLSVNIKNKKSAIFDIFIKNAGKNSVLKGHIFIENFKDINFTVKADYFKENTGILLNTKLICHKKTYSKLTGIADIGTNCPGCISDISFSAITDEEAKIEFLPIQRIKSEPKSADHSASIYRQTPVQIQYLRMAGLSTEEIRNIAYESFKNEYSLF